LEKRGTSNLRAGRKGGKRGGALIMKKSGLLVEAAPFQVLGPRRFTDQGRDHNACKGAVKERHHDHAYSF